ncbi:MAG: choice-of-anchor tandem repeat GloVer-containing protein, partial [Chthoniobacterales bacterium]
MINKYKLVSSVALVTAGLFLAAYSVSQATVANAGETLYSFAGGTDGKIPQGNLIMDAQSTLYGVTSDGGGSSLCFSGCGTLYKFEQGVESVLYAFAGGTDGFFPIGGLYRDAGGSLYGATNGGGASGLGTIFELATDGTKTILHSFAGGAEDGSSPNGDLIADAEGNLYGTTAFGGSGDFGTVFKITPGGQESIVYSFAGGAAHDGAYPSAGLIVDEEGNFYGTTSGGGRVANICGRSGCGTVYKITPAGQESVLYLFQGADGGSKPNGTLLRDAQGTLYSTTARGGRKGIGSVFALQSDGRLRILHSFGGNADGLIPAAGVIADAEGNLYGGVVLGGGHDGLVYQLTRQGAFTVLYNFPESIDGNFPVGRLLMDGAGNLIGNCTRGGAQDGGTIFLIEK